jgi:hypothetical protein
MGRLVAALRRQPVRAYLYGVLVPGEALAVAYGLVSDNRGALWLALGAAVLVVPAAEAARAKVTPMADPRTKDGRPAEILPEPADPPGGSWLR